jgi:hypothetical protein
MDRIAPLGERNIEPPDVRFRHGAASRHRTYAPSA